MVIIIGAPIIDMNAFENQGKYLIMDMGSKGAAEFKQKYKNAIFIYVIPPTKERLLSQMGTRGLERFERSKRQLHQVTDIYDWLIINNDVNTAVQEIEKIMHTVKEYSHNLDAIDIDTMKFLYDRNFHNKKNIDFLNKFYGEEEPCLPLCEF